MPPKILIIDDNPIDIKILEGILKTEDYETIGYSDNQKALKDVAQIDPDLILLDLIMPNINGFEMCRRLKNDHRTRHIPIIFATAEKDHTKESEGFELGAVDYITKPFDPIITKARVRNHIELKRHRDSLEFLIQERTVERDKSRQQFQDLVEKSLVGIAIIQDGRIIYQNPEITRIISDLATKIHEKNFDFIQSDNFEHLKNSYQKLLNRETTNVAADFQIMSDPDARNEMADKWVHCRASAFNYLGDEAILINLVDVTRTKELEKLLLNRNKMASLGRIASGMAHEIRNPLTGITSYLYTLDQLCESKTVLPKDINLMREIVGKLKLASHKVEAVIKRVLDFSKPTAPQMAVIDIKRCISNVLTLNAVTLRKAGIDVTMTIPTKLPSCFGDAALIEQVLLNLIQNAGRALKEKRDEKRMDVSAYVRDHHINISVSDSGPGVPDNLREKIFDPFFTTSSSGSGIGLSIAQRIVTDHYGSMTISTGELGGACFTITLPIEKRKFSR